MRAGVPAPEARRRARLDFGGEDHIKERCRDARGTRWVEDTGHDIRFALRLLTKERWFTVSAVGALALGIAGVTTIVTVINGYNFRGLPVAAPERVLALGTRDASSRPGGVSFLDFQDVRHASQSFAALAAFRPATMTLNDPDQSPESLGGAYVSAAAFSILGERAIVGRSVVPADDRQGAPPVVVLGYRLWVSRYGADPAVLGRVVVVNGTPATVVGVMAEGFEFPYREGVWQPLSQLAGIDTQPRDDRTLDVFGRLADGWSPAQARAELRSIATTLGHTYPETNTGIAPTAVRFGEQQVGRLGDTRPPLLLAATAAFVLLIACTNVANLLLARAAGRSREMAIRASVGATRWRLVRQLLVESLLLACAAGGLGLWLSRFGVRFIAEAFGRNVPYWMRFTVDSHVVLVLVALCAITSLLAGLAPALFVSKTDALGLMKEGGRAAMAPRVRRWTAGLLASQLALTMILLAGAGLLGHSFLALYRSDRVIDASRVLTLELRLPDTYATPEQRATLLASLDDRVSVLPEGPLTTIASRRPFVGAPRRTLSINGRPVDDRDRSPSVSTVFVGARYFDALGLRLLRGRGLARSDGMPGQDAAIVNQRLAETYFPNEDPIGQRIRLGEPGGTSAATGWLTVVGVSPTIRQGVAAGAGPVVYVPLRSYGGAEAALIVGGLPDPVTVTPVLRRAIASLDPHVTVFNVRPLEELQSDSRLQHRLLGAVLAVFAGVALALSMVGVYAMTAYAVVQRTHEVGVRMALGARPDQVMWLFVRRALRPLAAGVVIGLGGALLVGRLLQGLLIETSPTHPTTLVALVALLVTVTLTASFFPSRRAARLDPLSVLRDE